MRIHAYASIYDGARKTLLGSWPVDATEAVYCFALRLACRAPPERRARMTPRITGVNITRARNVYMQGP